jgi:hypothetical protein
MRSQLARALVILPFGLCLLAVSTLASWIPPPPVQWRLSQDRCYVMRIQNRSGEISVYRALDGEELLWHVKHPGFSQLFCVPFLVNDGATIIIVRGNHLVDGIYDPAMWIIDRSGSDYAVSASQFIDHLVQSPDRSSNSPGRMWLISILEVTDEKIVIVNALAERRELRFDDIRRWYSGDSSF